MLISIFVTMGMLLPLAFPCTPTECYIKQGDTAPYCPEGTSSSIKWVVHIGLDCGNLSSIRFQHAALCTASYSLGMNTGTDGIPGMPGSCAAPCRCSCGQLQLASVFSTGWRRHPQGAGVHRALAGPSC